MELRRNTDGVDRFARAVVGTALVAVATRALLEKRRGAVALPAVGE